MMKKWERATEKKFESIKTGLIQCKRRDIIECENEFIIYFIFVTKHEKSLFAV